VANSSALPVLFAKRFQAVISLIKVIFLAVLLVNLTACDSSSNLGSTLGSTVGLNSKSASNTQANAHSLKPIAFTPLVGVPADVSKKMLLAVKSTARAKKWPVTDDVSKAHYLVNGHFTAYPTSDGGKLSYIWDVKNNKGVHLHRVIGNELVKGKKTNNAWSLINDGIITKVADTSTGQLNTWFVANQQSSTKSPLNAPEDPTRISPIAQTQKTDEPIITGAVGKRTTSHLTLVQPVVGAPGDGRISLTNALRHELKKNGVPLSTRRAPGGYTVKGNVKLENVNNKQQKIQITWNVYDGQGHRVGTVSQKNTVPSGSLNGAWGPTAEAAASAAAKGIVKLLPSKK